MDMDSGDTSVIITFIKSLGCQHKFYWRLHDGGISFRLALSKELLAVFWLTDGYRLVVDQYWLVIRCHTLILVVQINIFVLEVMKDIWMGFCLLYVSQLETEASDRVSQEGKDRTRL